MTTPLAKMFDEYATMIGEHGGTMLGSIEEAAFYCGASAALLLLKHGADQDALVSEIMARRAIVMAQLGPYDIPADQDK